LAFIIYMKKEIILNSAVNHVRACITEEGEIAEYFIEFPEKERIIGNIYLGKVTNIVQGINAAFINIGLETDAFLHFSDVDESLESSIILDEDDEEEEEPVENPKENQKNKQKDTKKKLTHTFSTKKSGDFQINIEKNQNIVVQVTREAYSTKGVKVTSKIAIPGRYLVLLPYDKLLGVSKKIHFFKERKRLRYEAKKFLNKEYGCIIRTAAKGKSEEDLYNDWEYLKSVWEQVENKIKKSKAPELVYKDVTLTKTLVRDKFDNSVQSFIVDSKSIYNEITTYLKWVSPHLLNKVQLYKKPKPIFEYYGVDRDINNIYRRTVKLRSGGSIVIDQTEAMIVIDVNSGRSTDSEQELTALNTNLEALYEICKQIRLRDMGGMVIIDFIDMLREENKRKIFNEFKKIMSRDKAKSVVFPISELGLLQITRQRINQNISEKITDICPTCKGLGRVATPAMAINDLENWLKNFKGQSGEFRLLIRVNPQLADELMQGTISKLSKLMFKYFVRIKLLQDDTIPLTHFRVFSIKTQKEITKNYIS